MGQFGSIFWRRAMLIIAPVNARPLEIEIENIGFYLDTSASGSGRATCRLVVSFSRLLPAFRSRNFRPLRPHRKGFKCAEVGGIAGSQRRGRLKRLRVSFHPREI
jgi:hypothetical protein